MRVIRLFNHAANEARIGWQPALPLELALVEALELSALTESKSSEEASHKDPAILKQAEPISQRKASNVKLRTTESSVHLAPEADPLPQTISQQWREILAAVRQKNPQTQALLNSCKPLGIKGGALILGFNGEFARAKMEQVENLQILDYALRDVTGETMPVRCILTAGGELPDDIDQDGMVASALRDLGGEIVDIQ